MKSYFLGLVLWVCAAVAGAAPVDKSARFDFKAVNVSQAIDLIYREALQDAFVVDPDVVTDQRVVSFRYSAADGELRPFVRAFLDSLGLEVTRRGRVDFISKKRPEEAAMPPSEVFVYRPKFRDGSYLLDVVTPFLKGQLSAKRGVRAAAGDRAPSKDTTPGSAASLVDRDSDVIVYRGTAAEIKTLTALFKQIDVPEGGVSVRAVLYEVQTGAASGSAFSMALKVLGGRLGVSVGSPAPVGANTISINTTNFDAVLGALATDNRFVVRSSPTLSVKSGKSARLTVGEDVPVLGAVTYTGTGGTPVQSVEYRSAGVILDLSPVVHEDSIDLTLMQQVSNFVLTQTGVNNSPTLNKREVKTDLTVRDGEIVVFGGLTDEQQTDTHSGSRFLPSFLHTRSSDKSRTEILLLVQVSKLGG